MMLKVRYQILLLAAAVLGVFYPSIFAEFNSVDDRGMVTAILNTEHWTLKDVFVPGIQGGAYYRPILHLSFLLDKELWFLSTSFMHLENILFHLANSILVYFLTRRLLPPSNNATSYLPLVAALCFGIHPVCTEPVNWVSGRTDVLAGIFVLSSAITLLKFKQEQKKSYFFISIFLLLLGTLTKEVALAFLPGAFLLLIARNTHDDSGQTSPKEGRLRLAYKIIILSVIAAVPIAIFFVLRSIAVTSNSPKISLTLKFIFNDLNHAMFVFLRAFGFYIKKIYYPFPLNFAIVDVDPLYELLAIIIVILCVRYAFKRTFLSATYLSGIFMIVPSFPIAFNQIAWTPYAERYIYIATAFVIPVSVLLCAERLRQHDFRVALKAGVPCLLILAGVTTLQRNLVWQSNLALYEDCVDKSPTFSKVWNELGIAYRDNKDLKSAERCFLKASALYSIYYDEMSDMNLALVLKEQGREKEAHEVYKRVLKNGGDKSVKVLKDYLEFLGNRFAAEKNHSAKVRIVREELKYSKKLYDLTGDPKILYGTGDLHLFLGDRNSARENFSRAYDELQQNDKYKLFAKQKLLSLQAE